MPRAWPTGELERRIVPVPPGLPVAPLPRVVPLDAAAPRQPAAMLPVPRFASVALLDRLKSLSHRVPPGGRPAAD